MPVVERAVTAKGTDPRFKKVISKLGRYPRGTTMTRSGEILKLGNGTPSDFEKRGAAKQKIRKAKAMSRSDAKKMEKVRRILSKVTRK